MTDEYISQLSINAPELYDYVANEAEKVYNLGMDVIKRDGEIWLDLAHRFEHWYLGDKMYKDIFKKEPPDLPGKKGFINLDFMGNLGHSIVRQKSDREDECNG